MKILIFNWKDLKHIWAGGGEIYVFELATRWAKLGHEVSVFCGQDVYTKLPSFERIKGINIYRRGGKYSVYIWAIYYYFKFFRKNIDIVIDVENGIPFFTPLYCSIPKIAFVYHIHGKQFFYEMPTPINYIGFAIERFIFPLLYKNVPIVAISKTTQQQLKKIGFNPNNISLLYCGVNGSTGHIKKSTKFTYPTILYLGRVKKYKRVDLLVNIFPKIIEKIPRANLIIAGWGSEASNIADLVMRSSLRKKIRLVGPVNNNEKKTLLSKAWIFVNPSIGEGWSISVIEANLHGTPAVSFQVPGLTESIQHGKTGLLASHEEDFVNKICTLLTKRKLREKLSKNAQAWAKGFTWDRSARNGLLILRNSVRK